MGGRLRRILSWMLVAALLVGLLPVVAAAAETWQEVAFNDIQPTDVIAITMTAGETTYVMQNDGGTSTYGKCTTWDSATTTDASWKWNIVPTTGGYTIYPAGDTSQWLYTINSNNGLRVGSSETGNVWNVDVGTETNSGYLYANDGTQNRYVGVYTTGPNFRDYTSPNGQNIKGQTPKFYKLSGGAPVTPKCAKPTSDVKNGTVPVGTRVTVKTTTEEASLQITSGDATVTKDSPYTISLDTVGTYTAEVKAVKADWTDSDVLNLSYTVKAPTVATIAEARGGKANEYYTVTGVVTMMDGSNIYVQDNTAGIDLYFNAKPSGLALGDEITATGYWTTFNGLVELKDVAGYEKKTENNPLPSVTKTIAEINADYAGKKALQAQRVFIDDAVIGPINTKGDTTLTQGDDTLIIYKIPDVTKNDPAVAEGDTVDVYGVISDYNKLQLRVAQAGDVAWVASPEVPPEPATLPETGEYVIWAKAYHQAVSSTTDDSGYYLGETVTENDSGTLSGPTQTAVWTVTRTDTTGNADSGTYTIAQGGKLLGANAGGKLTWEETPASSEWTVEVSGTNLVMKCGGKYLEWYKDYNDWSLYGSSAGSDLYYMAFTPASQVLLPEISQYETDADVEQSIAAWGGGMAAYPDGTTQGNGDLYKALDQKDADALFTAATADGTAKSVMTTGSGNHYMGVTGLGVGGYLQFQMPTTGYADMTLTFRLYGTGTSASTYALEYSTDGTTFKPFSTGSCHYSYTPYNSDGTAGTPVDQNSSITDGTATLYREKTNHEFTLDVPAGAENQSQVLIRLVAGDKNIKNDGAPSATGGNLRIDSVVLSGHPIVGEKFTSYVTVTPDNEEDQAAGTELTLACATEGAAISYRFVNPETAEVVTDWATYDATAKPKLPALPTVLEAKAAAADKAESITRVWVYAAGTVAAVKMDPNGGGVYIPTESDTVQVTLSCDTADAVIHYSVNGGEYQVYDPATKSIELSKGFGTMTVSAYATKEGFKDSAVTTRTFTERQSAEYSLFFGQLHSHTNYSDGAGTCDEAFKHAKGLGDEWNIDFLAVTDHSNSFDNADSASLADGSMSEEWKEGHDLAKAATDETFTGIYGFEMTWSNGLGHINTFNTPGFQSRTQADYKTYNTALQNYYAALKTQSDSISQFNHPGTTFGDFSDFAHYDEEIDDLITLIEVGNGEGAIGSSGYFPSYEYYTRALDKGWHVAPTNNQDNHKGNWGDSNTGRSVVLADSSSQESIYDAMRNYRVYATEDLNLEIRYTLDGNVMGTILDGASGDTAHIKVELKDADDTAAAKVQVIVNGGLVAAEKSATCNETVEFDVPTTYAYYYIKVIQADGDIAVTAPVWLGKVEAVGVSSMTAASDLTVAGQEQTITLELFNNENKNLDVTSIVFTDKATGEVLATDDTITSVKKLSTASCSFTHVFHQDGVFTIRATVKGTLGGVEKTYTQDLELTVMPEKLVRTVIVDGTHYNDYVTGYYGGNMNNMTSIAAEVGVQVKVIPHGETITPEMLENCALMVISAPARNTGTANAGDFEPSAFEDDFIDMVKNYVAGGGKVAVCGLADYQDKKASNPDNHTSAQINKLLAAIGSTMTINDDEVIDLENNGGQEYRLYPENFNMDSRWTKGIVAKDSVAEGENYQKYSQYSGCSVNPGKTGTWLVKGFDSTWSADSDKDGVGILPDVSYTYQSGTNDDGSPKMITYNAVVDKGDVYFLAADTVGAGTVFAAGGVFLSDFEVKAELDNIWDLPYANRTIYENILAAVREDVEPTPIADIRKADLNRVFVAEGYVTNGTENENTKFFDAIYIQDETGGITVFPYSVEGLAIGTKVQVIGYTDAYQGDKELQITSLQVLDAEPKVYEPKTLSTKDAADYDTYGGQLVKTEGKVSAIVKDGGVVSQFKLTDSSGVSATVFIDGYITNPKGENTIGSWIKDGDTVSAVGLSYLHPEGSSDVSVPVLRVRNCDEVVLVSAAPSGTGSGAKPSSSTNPTSPTTQTTVEEKEDGTVITTVTDAKGDKSISVVNADGETVAEVSLPADLSLGEKTFEDVPEDHWAHQSIYTIAAMGVVEGVGDNRFDMVTPMTRGALATVLHRLSNKPAGGEISFEDVADDTYYTEGVAWAAKVGVVKGISPETFLPDEAITREQLAVMLCRYAQLLGQDTTAKAEALDAFQDGGEAGDWAVDSLAWCVEKGIILGKGGEVLDPLADVSRAEAATMIYRLVNLLFAD